MSCSDCFFASAQKRPTSLVSFVVQKRPSNALQKRLDSSVQEPYKKIACHALIALSLQRKRGLRV